MPRNIFRRWEAYLEAGGRQVSTLLCNVSRTAGGNKVWNFRQMQACSAVRLYVNSCRAQRHEKNTLCLTECDSQVRKWFLLDIKKKTPSQWRNKMAEGQNSACIEVDPDSSVCYPDDNFCTGWRMCFWGSKNTALCYYSTSELFWDMLLTACCSVLSYVVHVSHKQYHSRHLRVPNCTTSSAIAGVGNLSSISCLDATSRKSKHYLNK